MPMIVRNVYDDQAVAAVLLPVPRQIGFEGSEPEFGLGEHL